MTTTEINPPAGAKPAKSRTVDLKLEVIVIPVSDVDRAKAFYSSLGWRLDADFASGDGWRVIQFTPPGSACSVIFGKNVTPAEPGSAQGLYLIVSDLKRHGRICSRVVSRSASPSTVAATFTLAPTSRISSAVSGSTALIQNAAATAHLPPSGIPTATVGYSRKSPRGCPAVSTRRIRRSLRQVNLRVRCAARPRRMASTRNGPVSTTRTGRTGTPITSCASKPASRCRPKSAADA